MKSRSISEPSSKMRPSLAHLTRTWGTCSSLDNQANHYLKSSQIIQNPSTPQCFLAGTVRCAKIRSVHQGRSELPAFQQATLLAEETPYVLWSKDEINGLWSSLPFNGNPNIMGNYIICSRTDDHPPIWVYNCIIIDKL